MTTQALCLIDAIVALVQPDDELIDQYPELIETAIIMAHRLHKILAYLYKIESGVDITILDCTTDERYTDTEYEEVMYILTLMKNDIYELAYVAHKSGQLLKPLVELRDHALSANSKI